MKKFSFLLAFVVLLLSGAVLAPSAMAASRANVFLFDTPHRDLNGVALDTDLSASLAPEGALGLLVFSAAAEPRRWLIDAALIEDVVALAESDLVAQEWLAQLKVISAGDLIFAIPYGHPDLAASKKLAPSELTYYYETSKARLQKILGRDVLINRGLHWSSHQAKIPSAVVDSYLLNSRALALLNTVLPPAELDNLRAKLSFLLATDTTSAKRLYFAQNADTAVDAEQHKLRIVAGKYRLTSEHEKVPITLVNDFNSPVVVQLQLTPLNSRIHVNDIDSVTLLAKSKVQLSVPVTVIASGSTAVLAQFTNPKGQLFPGSVMLVLNLSVISPAVAWFTTTAALLLFLAAIAQSVRRVRRARK